MTQRSSHPSLCSGQLMQSVGAAQCQAIGAWLPLYSAFQLLPPLLIVKDIIPCHILLGSMSGASARQSGK